MDIADIYTQFPILLQQRVSYQRKIHQTNLARLSDGLVQLIVISGDSPFLHELLAESVNSILLDCEIYHGMTSVKAVDALLELSSLACLFVNRNENVYDRICKLITQLQNSYPASMDEDEN